MRPTTGELRQLESLKDFSDAEVSALARYMKRQDAPPGHVFTTQGQPGRGLFLILGGEVVVSRRDEIGAQSQEMKILRQGEIFGVLSLLHRLPAAANCTAKGPVTVAFLPRSDYEALFRISAPVAYHFQLLVAQQLALDLRDRNEMLRRHLLEI